MNPTKCFSQRRHRCSFILCCQSHCSLLGCCGGSSVAAWRLRQPGCQFPRVPCLCAGQGWSRLIPWAPRFSGARDEPSRPRWPVVCDVLFVGLTTSLGTSLSSLLSCAKKSTSAEGPFRRRPRYCLRRMKVWDTNHTSLQHSLESESFCALFCHSSPHLAMSLSLSALRRQASSRVCGGASAMREQSPFRDCGDIARWGRQLDGCRGTRAPLRRVE